MASTSVVRALSLMLSEQYTDSGAKIQNPDVQPDRPTSGHAARSIAEVSNGYLLTVIKHLTRKNRILDSLIHTSTMAIWFTNEAGDYELANPRWSHWSGIPLSEALGDFDQKKEANNPLHLPEIDNKAITQRRSYSTEIRFKGEDYKQQMLLVTRYPVYDEHQQLLGLGGTAADLTETRRADEQARINRELTETNTFLKQFGSVVAHDLRAPLNRVSGFLHLIEHRLTERNTNEELKYLHRADAAVKHLGGLISAFESLGKIRLDPRKKSLVRLADLLDDVQSTLQKELEETESVVKVKVGSSVIEGDQRLLKQLFLNLLNNSIKYRRASTPLKVTVSAEQATKPGDIRITMTDNGSGFEQDQAVRIFYPLVRLPSSQSDGMGIGLALCSRIVAVHGGEIKAEGQPNQGATFQVLLPGQMGSTTDATSGETTF